MSPKLTPSGFEGLFLRHQVKKAAPLLQTLTSLRRESFVGFNLFKYHTRDN